MGPADRQGHGATPQGGVILIARVMGPPIARVMGPVSRPKSRSDAATE
jgi:hypothetical protein